MEYWNINTLFIINIINPLNHHVWCFKIPIDHPFLHSHTPGMADLDVSRLLAGLQRGAVPGGGRRLRNWWRSRRNGWKSNGRMVIFFMEHILPVLPAKMGEFRWISMKFMGENGDCSWNFIIDTCDLSGLNGIYRDDHGDIAKHVMENLCGIQKGWLPGPLIFGYTNCFGTAHWSVHKYTKLMIFHSSRRDIIMSTRASTHATLIGLIETIEEPDVLLIPSVISASTKKMFVVPLIPRIEGRKTWYSAKKHDFEWPCGYLNFIPSQINNWHDDKTP